MSDRIEQLRREWGERSDRLGFTQRAVLFKRFPGWLNDSIHRRHVKFITDNLPSSVTNVLDVGCGYGRISAELVQHLPAAGFEGIDLCTEFADQFRDNIGPCFNGALQDYRPDKEFQLIIIVTTLMYLSAAEQKEAIRRLWASLSPNGRIVCIEPASELFNLWRRLTGRESASPTGGTVDHFLRDQLSANFVDLENAKILNASSIRVLPFINGTAVHHCVATSKESKND